MVEDYHIGVWDVGLDLNVSDGSIKEACKTDCPTCCMVFDMHSSPGRRSQANPHQSSDCRLCNMVELYAHSILGVRSIESYSKTNNL